MDRKGERFGRLVVMEPAEAAKGRSRWLCKCDCGKSLVVSSKHLRVGGTLSCGCFRSARTKEVRASEAKSFESRLLRMPNGCLEWQGARDKGGYGTLRSGGKDFKAHRVAFEKSFGKIPAGLSVCHTCDNPSCCEPDHLFIGTSIDNNADRHRKGRSAKGEANGFAKINAHIVKQVRAAAERGVSQQAIADMIGIHQTAVSRIIRRKSWAHVP